MAGQRLLFDIFEELPKRSHPAAVLLEARSVAVACSIESRNGTRVVRDGGACIANENQAQLAEYALSDEDMAALVAGPYTAWLYVTKAGVPLSQQPPPIHFEVARSRARPVAAQDDSQTVTIF